MKNIYIYLILLIDNELLYNNMLDQEKTKQLNYTFINNNFKNLFNKKYYINIYVYLYIYDFNIGSI